MKRILGALALLPMLTAAMCTGPTIVEKEFVTVHVPVRAPCPDDETYAKVIAARPVPLREQPRPEGEEAERAAIKAQLGRYEMPEGWADQAKTVIDDCHARAPIGTPPG